MRNNSDWRRVTSFSLWFFTAVLVISTTAYAQTAAKDPGGSRCSNRILSGSYGYSAQGQVLPAPGLAFPFTSTGMVNFDGNGNLSWVEPTVIGGMVTGSVVVLLAPELSKFSKCSPAFGCPAGETVAKTGLLLS